VIGRHTDISGRRQLEEQLRLQAEYDRVTGLPNRNHLMTYLSSLIKQSHKIKDGIEMIHDFALMFIDLDRFKQINDTYGHSA
jgi:diguanylate cyclase (GGDEF)-like protein